MIDVSDFINFTDKQLETLSNITDADIEMAKLLWKKSVDEEFAELLDAEPEEQLNNA